MTARLVVQVVLRIPLPYTSYLGQNVFNKGGVSGYQSFPNLILVPKAPIFQTDHHTFPFRFVERI